MLVSRIDDFKFDLNKLIAEYIELDLTEPFIEEGFVRKFHLVQLNKVPPDVLLKVPYTNSLINHLKQFTGVDFNNITYRVLYPNAQYRWHKDLHYTEYSYHIPLITNDSCYFLYENDIKYAMPAGFLYKTQVHLNHTFKNAGNAERVHITFEKIAR